MPLPGTGGKIRTPSDVRSVQFSQHAHNPPDAIGGNGAEGVTVTKDHAGSSEK
jgi:hypothetical protein